MSRKRKKKDKRIPNSGMGHWDLWGDGTARSTPNKAQTKKKNDKRQKQKGWDE